MNRRNLMTMVEEEFPTLPKWMRSAAVDVWLADPDFYRSYDKKKDKKKKEPPSKPSPGGAFDVLDDYPAALISQLEVYHAANNVPDEPAPADDGASVSRAQA